VKEAWSFALFVLTIGAGWLMDFEAEVLCALVDALHCLGAAEQWVFVIGRLFHFLTMLAIFLESDLMNGSA
jgi:hypothetical protein